MRTRGLVLAIALLLVLLALGVTCAVPPVGAQEEEPEELGCPPCDASLEVEVVAGCLSTNDEGVTTGNGTLRVRNTGEQGTSIATLQAFFTENGGSGTIEPDEVVLQLEPSGVWTEIQFSVTVTTTKPDGSIQIRWEITWESCRPYHNIGKGDTVDFEGCPTVIKLIAFTAQSEEEKQEEESPSPWKPLVFGLGGMGILSIVTWRYRP